MDLTRSVYVHVPFCDRRCGYCNFAVIADRDDLHTRYVAALRRELTTKLSGDDVGPIRTIYFGGGTPTSLPPAVLGDILESIDLNVRIDADAEISLEANPSHLAGSPPGLADQLRTAGFNRISLGVQSFDDGKLRALQRDHVGDQAIVAVRRAAAAFDDVSIDLIFAAPGETTEGWQRDLEVAAALPITHLSAYELTIEKGTTFWARHRRGEWTDPPEKDVVAMYEATEAVFGRGDWRRYEISNYARARRVCRHNSTYWDGNPWIGVGAGAAEFRRRRRRVNRFSVTGYLKQMERDGSATVSESILTPATAAAEWLAFGVRRLDGVDRGDPRLKDLNPDRLVATLDRLRRHGVIGDVGDRIRLTPRGKLLADAVAAELLELGDDPPSDRARQNAPAAVSESS